MGAENKKDVAEKTVQDFSLGGEDVHVGDVIGFDEGAVAGKQTEKEEWIVRFGKWGCTCGDYYCNEHGIGYYVEGYHQYYRTSGEVSKWEYTQTILGVSNKCRVLGKEKS